MKKIVLDGSKWRSVLDFYDALLPAIGAPPWHGKNINALIDSMIYGGINALAPPYVVIVRGAKSMPADVKSEILILQGEIDEAAPPGTDANGGGVDVHLELED